MLLSEVLLDNVEAGRRQPLFHLTQKDFKAWRCQNCFQSLVEIDNGKIRRTPILSNISLLLCDGDF